MWHHKTSYVTGEKREKFYELACFDLDNAEIKTCKLLFFFFVFRISCEQLHVLISLARGDNNSTNQQNRNIQVVRMDSILFLGSRVEKFSHPLPVYLEITFHNFAIENTVFRSFMPIFYFYMPLHIFRNKHGLYKNSFLYFNATA